jgi:uncharacterized protein
MQFIYVTDLHGWEEGYLKIFEIAKERGCRAIINGGDMLPKGPGALEKQKKFVKGFLDTYFKVCDTHGIWNYAMFGNDDFRSRLKYWKEMIAKHPGVRDISETSEPLIGTDLSVRGFNYVPDYPFGMKDWCTLDHDGWKRPECMKPIVSTDNGIQPCDPDMLFKTRGPIAEMLRSISNEYGNSMRKTIFVSHCPPAGVGLASILDNMNLRDVGSAAVAEWIGKVQPLASFHGHIHENFMLERKYTAQIGSTLCVQPGQMKPTLTYVLADLKGDKMVTERYEVQI